MCVGLSLSIKMLNKFGEKGELITCSTEQLTKSNGRAAEQLSQAKVYLISHFPFKYNSKLCDLFRGATALNRLAFQLILAA